VSAETWWKSFGYSIPRKTAQICFIEIEPSFSEGGLSKVEKDKWIVGWFRAKVKLHRRSPERDVRETLTEVVLGRKKEIAREMRTDLQELEDKYGLFSDSAKVIREMRDTRG
jgi:plasmid stability protein